MLLTLGVACKGDHIILERNPFNPDDNNAIKVLDGDNFQVGHIKKEDAKPISQALKMFKMKMNGIITDDGDDYKMHVAVHMFTTEEIDNEQVKEIVNFFYSSFGRSFRLA